MENNTITSSELLDRINKWRKKGNKEEEIIPAGTIVDGDVVIRNITIGKEWGAIFFKDVRFTGKVIFDKVIFRRPVKFSKSVFEKEVIFNKIKFRGWATFNGATFESSVRFSNVKFSFCAYFSGVTFGCKTDFKKVTFGALAYFTDSEFCSSATFTKSKFHYDTGFKRAKFHGDLKFEQVVFFTKTWSYKYECQGEICGTVSFIGAEFMSKTCFKNVRGRTVYFHGIKVAGEVTVVDYIWNKWLNRNIFIYVNENVKISNSIHGINVKQTITVGRSH